MKAIVNGVEYDNVSLTGSGISFESDMTLAEIEQAFTPGSNATITITEGDYEVAKYINRGLNTISVSGSDPRIVRVEFDLTQIPENAETELRSSIDDSDDAIAELAELVAELEALDMQGMAAELQSHQETIDTWFSYSQDILSFINTLRADGGVLDQLNARIKYLEDKEASNNG